MENLPCKIIADLQEDDVVDIIACTSEQEILPDVLKWACGEKSFACLERQLSKVVHALNVWEQQYDWYVKTRPEIAVLSPIDLKSLEPNTIHGRARVYLGPKKLQYGGSVGGPGPMAQFSGDLRADAETKNLILDDQIYIFDHEVRKNGAFLPITSVSQNEWDHTAIWRSRNININVIGINCILFGSCYSGNLPGLTQ